MSRKRVLVLSAGVLALAAAFAAFYFLAGGPTVPEAAGLRSFVRSAPPVPVVFTSRTEPASFDAPAPEAEGFTYPGTTPWAAREGRLRLLDSDGRVYELTWGRPLPGGGTLIDVMSPSVSLDGRRVLFAGRKAPPDPGRWRVYEVNVDGSGLRQLTGGPDDRGCVELPPLRYAADGSPMAPDDRRWLDYDDVDPADLGPNGFAFASSRLPDLGRDHARRATQIWIWPPGAAVPRALSANRNNDRWPVLAAGQYILFSLWSRNREAVTADRTDVRPVVPGGEYATTGTDLWEGVRVQADGIQFGYTVKIPEPVWRQRPLFNGRVAFMSHDPADPARLRIAQADWGYLRISPSAAVGGRLPNQVGDRLTWGPDADADGRPLTAGCPSPLPDSGVLFAAGPAGGKPETVGLYAVPDDWTAGRPIPKLLFDDPGLVDAEPVAVYRRDVTVASVTPPEAVGQTRPGQLRLVSGTVHTGEVGYLENSLIHGLSPDRIPGQKTDAGEEPVISPPPGVKAVAVFAAHRDRFDDPVRPRVPGGWERLLVAPLDDQGNFRAWVPASPTAPTVLAGLDAQGKVVKWTSPAKDSAGRRATFFAIAGDHYSGTRPNGYHFCVGCHPGHTYIDVDVRERVR